MIKLALLKSGEDVIADIAEMVIKDSNDQEKIVGYFFKDPCIATLQGEQLEDESEGRRSPFKIRLTPWMPLAKDERIPVVVDWVVSLTEPMDVLKEMYVNGIKGRNDGQSESTSTGERPEDLESSGRDSE